MFGKDIAAKSMMFFQQKQQLNFMIQSIKEATAGQFSAPPPPPPQPQPQQQQAQNNFQEEDFSVVEDEPTNINAIKPDIIIAPKKRGRPKR